MANISMDHRLIDNTDFFVLHAGHLSVTGAHYDSIADPDAVLEWFVGARWQAVEFVEIRGARHFTTERLIGHVARLTSTKSIEFVNQNISDRHAALLADLPSLTAVSITRSRILTERGVSILRARRLTRLEIVGCPNIEQPNMRFTSDQLGE